MHTRRVAARHAWTHRGLLSDVALTIDGAGIVVDIGPIKPQDTRLDGILLPGLVNAHTHLELSHHPRPVGKRHLGSAGWVHALHQSPPAGPSTSLSTEERGARQARALGTAFVIDVSNGGHTAPAIAAAGLRGVVQHECIGLTPERYESALSTSQPTAPGVAVRPTAHSPISCAPELLRRALTAPGPVPTLHCDEDPADRDLLAHREGPWAAFHEGLAGFLPGHPWRTALGTARSGVALLSALGLLGPELGLVHLTAADDADLDLIAESGATAVLCPRSNLHITGRLPDVPGMVSRGIPLAIGTDSRASSPDLDPIAEGIALARAFPQLDPTLWLTALTNGGARLLPHSSAGALRENSHTGVILVEVEATSDPVSALFSGPRWPRRWLT